MNTPETHTVRISVSDETRAVLAAALDLPIPDDVAARLHLPSTDPLTYRPGGEHHPTTTVAKAGAGHLDVTGDTTGVARTSDPAAGANTITVSLTIENRYEHSSHDATTYAVDRVVLAPPCDPADDPDAFDSWAQEHIMPFTGAGHCEGDAWYDVEVTASSEPALVGRTFEFGY